jgi:preprotein translocase subunit SecD
MNLRPTELLVIKRDTVERAVQTIYNRVNNIGVSEPIVTQHGRADAEFEIHRAVAGRRRPGPRERSHRNGGGSGDL